MNLKNFKRRIRKISLHNQKVKEKYEETGDSLEKSAVVSVWGKQ